MLNNFFYTMVWYNPFSWGKDILDGVVGLLYWLLCWIDSVIYSFISYVYNIFVVLAQTTDIIDATFIDEFIDRLYIILGVVMLFILAYSLLRSMINPDESFKGKESPVKIIQNVIISVVLIALMPTIFDFAMEFQNSILINNTIGKIIVGATGEGTADTIRDGGYEMAAGVYKAFFHANDGYCEVGEEESGNCKVICIEHPDENLTAEQCRSKGAMTYSDLWAKAKEATTFHVLISASKNIRDGEISYFLLIAPAAGILVLLILVSYCIDIAIRLVKLNVYEILSPIFILARIIPQEQAKKMFGNWLKATTSTFLEVFIRIGLLYFAVMVISTVTKSIDNVFDPLFNSSGVTTLFGVKFIAQAFIIIGIIMFVKQAPEIIKELTGLDGGKYNPLKSAKQGLSLLAGGIAGGSPIAGVRAWEQAGQAKNLLDFSAIGNQYKRKLAKQEAKEQGANWKDRAGDSIRKAFGWETKLERSNRRLERGLDMDGKTQTFTNDTDGDIVLKDEKGNIITTIAQGATVQMDEKMQNLLQHQKDLNAKELSEFDEQIRHIKEGQALDQKYIDWRAKIKKKALEKINEGHNHITRDLILDDGTNIGNMNYAAMLAYKQSRVNAGASADEIQRLEKAIKQAEDDMWVTYSNWAIEHDKGGEISTWYDQAMQYHDDVGLYDAETGEMFKYDKADLNAQMSTIVDGYANKMAFFESKKIKLVQKDGVTAYTDASGVQKEARGLDKTAKANANGADTQIQHIEIQKTDADDSTKRIDRMTKQLEEAKTQLKSTEEYMRYKASDNANKIDDSGKK